jgi:hypothetical protein
MGIFYREASSIVRWLRLLWSKTVWLAFTSGMTVILYALLFYIVNFLWMVYIETPIGKRFLALYTLDIATIEGFRAENFFMLSLEVILAVLMVCLVVGAVSQAFLLIRYFYEGRGLLFRLIVWGIPCAVLTAAAICKIYEIGPVASFLLAVVPTMALFQSCLRLTHAVLPEISTAIGGIASLARKVLNKERRAEPRCDMSCFLAYRGPRGSDECRSIATQISNHGFCIQDSKNLVSGDIIRFELKIEDHSILGEAMVKWTSDATTDDGKKARSSKSGCRIVSMDTKFRGILKDFLRRQSSEGT